MSDMTHVMSGEERDHSCQEEDEQEDWTSAELSGTGDGQSDEDSGDGIAAVVVDLLDLTVLHSVTLFAVQRVQCLVEKDAQSAHHKCP